MQLSYFSDYSLRVLMYAALREDSFQLDDVATAYNISKHHLSKVVNKLAKMGLLQTRRGRGGCIQLAVPPESISIGSLVRSTESEAPFVECFNPETNACRLNGHCRLKGVLATAQNAFYAHLDQYSLQDLVAPPQRRSMKRALALSEGR